MSDDSFSAAPLTSVETPLSTGSDVFTELTAALDVARNQFRARQYQKASAACGQVAASAERQLAVAAGLTREDTERIHIALASALTLDGRCAEELEQGPRAQELWQRAVGIFDESLGNSVQPGEGILSRFGRWVGLLGASGDPKKNLPGDLLVYYGTALRMVGRRKDAIAVLRQVTQMASFPPETYRHLGLALNDEREYAKAVEELKKGLERAPSDRGTWLGLVQAEIGLGHNLEAARAYLGLAQAQLAAGQIEKALAATEDSLRLNEGDPVALRSRGDLLRLLGRFSEALETLDQALRRSPSDPLAWTVKGATLFAVNRPEEAVSAFDRALQMNPHDARTLAMKGEVFMTLQRNEEARDALAESVRLNPVFAPAVAVLGSVLLSLDRPQESLEQADNALKLRPSALAWQVRAESLKRLARLDEALESYDRAAQLSGKPSARSSIAVGKAELLSTIGRTEEALSVLDRVIQDDPDNASALIQKGKILWQTTGSRQREGAELLAKAAKLHPSVREASEITPILASAGFAQEALQSADLALQSGPPQASVLFARAQALQSLNRHEEALTMAEEGLRRPAGPAPSAAAFGLGLKGLSLGALGRVDEAIGALQDSTRLDPGLDWTWRALSRLLIYENKLEAGLSAAERALERKPNDPETVALKAHALGALDRVPDAIACLNGLKALEPGSHWIHERLAELYERLQDHPAALRELTECIDRNDGPASAYASRGFVYHSMGKRTDAEADLKQALALDPQLAWAYAELAAVQRELDKPKEALSAINRALAIQPDYTAGLEIKGEIFIAIGEFEAALKVFDRVKEVSPALHFWKGLALDNLNRLEDARQCYEKALEANREDVWSLRALADIRLLQGETDAACAMFDQILSKIPESSSNVYEFGLCGWCHYGCRRLEKAIQFYSQALALDRYGVLKSGQFDLALVLTCAQRYSLAIREYRRAIDLAHTADKWLQKNLFRVAIIDLVRAMEMRYPAIAAAPETHRVLAQLNEELQMLSADPDHPLVD
jgi:tetratricopeptide (TPR) repeat protein